MKLVKLICAFLFAAIMAIVISKSIETSAIPVFIVLVIAGIALGGMQKTGMAYMAVTLEIWENDILQNLFKNNDFARRAYNADQYVLAGKVVHIPRAGAPSGVTKNLSVFPAIAVKRTDDDVTYPIDTYYSTPRHIENIEKYELSYDKRQSALGEDQNALIDTAMDGLIYNWLPLVANTVLTDGAAAPATLAGATGTRKTITKNSFQAVKLKMDKAKIPTNGRVAILTSDHYNQFFNSLSEGEKTNFNNFADNKTGIVGKYLNFDIMMRSTMGRYRGADGAFVKVDEYAAGFGASDQTGDRAASLIYHDQSAERALGGVEMFDRPNDPLYYGDVFSFQLRIGGRIRRDAGVYAIVESL